MYAHRLSKCVVGALLVTLILSAIALFVLADAARPSGLARVTLEQTARFIPPSSMPDDQQTALFIPPSSMPDDQQVAKWLPPARQIQGDGAQLS